MAGYPSTKSPNQNIMKAYEKFNNALRDHYLYAEWVKQGEFGRIGTETATGITIFVHEGDDDKYSMFRFPSIKEMQEYDAFRLKALDEFCDHDDARFVYNLCKWVANPKQPCPLYPVDVFFLWDDYKVMDFEDDVEEKTERYEEWCADCDHVVDIANEFRVQKCPNCGKWLVPCSICPLENCSKHCPLERYAIILNGESVE